MTSLVRRVRTGAPATRRELMVIATVGVVGLVHGVGGWVYGSRSDVDERNGTVLQWATVVGCAVVAGLLVIAYFDRRAKQADARVMLLELRTLVDIVRERTGRPFVMEKDDFLRLVTEARLHSGRMTAIGQHENARTILVLLAELTDRIDVWDTDGTDPADGSGGVGSRRAWLR